MRQRPQFLLEAFAAAGHPVFFVDPSLGKSRQLGTIHLVPDLTAVPGRSVILYAHFPLVRQLFSMFEDATSIYDVLDDASIYRTDPDRTIMDGHAALLREAALVTVSSQVLGDRHRRARPDLLVVENGVDPEQFRHPLSRPSDLPPPPIVGFHGAIARWFDFELLEGVAASLPGWHFVLIGPIDPEVRDQVRRLRRLPNLSILGERPSSQIGAYVRAFQVGAIWFSIDGLTEAVSPLKLFEYLAAGVPVVSTPLPAAFGVPGVEVAAAPDHFAKAVVGAMEMRSDPAFQDAAAQAAASAAWPRRLAPVLSRLEELGRRWA